MSLRNLTRRGALERAGLDAETPCQPCSTRFGIETPWWYCVCPTMPAADETWTEASDREADDGGDEET